MIRFLLIGLLVTAVFLQTVVTEVIFVAELFRHGARSASTNRIPFNQSYEVPPSSLTANGEYMQYLLGSYMRETYIENQHLLSPSYEEEEILVLSSRTSRTIDSAYSHLAGLYPPGTGANISNPNIVNILPFKYASNSSSLSKNTPALPFNWQSIPVYTAAERDDKILHGHDGLACPNADIFQVASESTLIYVQVQNMLSNTITNLAAALKTPVSKVDMKYVKKIFSELQCALYEGFFNLPIQPGSELWSNMSFAYNFANVYKITYMPEALKAYATHFLQDLRDVIVSVENKTSSLKMKIYSAHDYTLITVLNHFKLISWECKLDQFMGKPQTPCAAIPEFTAQIIWELHNLSGEHFVLMKYNNEVQNICGSDDGMCRLTDFITLLETGILEEAEFNRICGIKTGSDSVIDGRKKKKALRRTEDTYIQMI